MVKNGGAFKHIHRWPRKLLQMIFKGGDSDGTIAKDEEIFYIWSRSVVPLKAHSPMAKETSSNDLQWWWRWWNTHRSRRKLLQRVKNGGADDCTFTDGLGSFFKWSSMVMTLLEHSPKSKKTSSSDKNKNNSKNDTSRLVIPPLMRWVIKGPSQNNCVVWSTEVADGTTRVT